MPRRVRELEEKAIYPIFVRGNNRQKIFRDHEKLASDTVEVSVTILLPCMSYNKN